MFYSCTQCNNIAFYTVATTCSMISNAATSCTGGARQILITRVSEMIHMCYDQHCISLLTRKLSDCARALLLYVSTWGKLIFEFGTASKARTVPSQVRLYFFLSSQVTTPKSAEDLFRVPVGTLRKCPPKKLPVAVFKKLPLRNPKEYRSFESSRNVEFQQNCTLAKPRLFTRVSLPWDRIELDGLPADGLPVTEGGAAVSHPGEKARTDDLMWWLWQRTGVQIDYRINYNIMLFL